MNDWLASGKSRGEFERDWRAAFMAVKKFLASQPSARSAKLKLRKYTGSLEFDFRAFDLDTLRHSDNLFTGDVRRFVDLGLSLTLIRERSPKL